MNNRKLRIAYMILSGSCYLMFIGVSIFVWLNAQGLQEINRFGIFVFGCLMLLFMGVYSSVFIWRWIKDGKI